jgi:hypothetical protein
MSNATLSPTWSGPRFAATVLAAFAVVVLIFGIQASAAQACSAGTEVCTWTNPFYGGVEVGRPCLSQVGFWEDFQTEDKSAKNRCGGESFRIGWTEGSSTSWKACLSPGGERPEPGRFNTYERVGSC